METYSFGEWMKTRRKALRLTQREVGAAVFCSTAMIKKIEADERRPSVELAHLLAVILQIPAEQHGVFAEIARGERPLDHLEVNPRMIRLAAFSPSKLVLPPLPVTATPFIGRKTELTEVATKLHQPECRLLTLHGPGGIGKTRLAIETARQLQTDFSDGVLFVPLAAIHDPRQLPMAIFEALRLPPGGSDPPLLQAQRLFRHRHLLLVMDNFEQLAVAAAMLAELLEAASGLKILVTSRERLNLVEEWLFPVQELAEAPALFAQTAVRVKPDFDVFAQESAVSSICRLVGYHPLAVELAASWTRFMSCTQIAEQIQQDLDFFGHAPRNAPERHRSIRALFDHSWQWLTPAEQASLARLSVFRGGFSLEQAAEVAGASWPVLIALVDKSLVEARGDKRFDLHPLTRQYAAEKLAWSGETQAMKRAHFATFSSLAKQLNSWFTSSDAAANFRQSHRELENYRAALRWGLENAETDSMRAFAHHLYVFWLRGGYWQEGERWMSTVAAKMPDKDSVYLALTLAHQGVFAALQGRFSEAHPTTERAFRMARRLEEPWPLVLTLQIQGQSRRDKEGSLAAFTEAITICEKHLDEPKFNAFLGSLLGLQGDRLMDFGMLTEAKASFEASVAHLRALGDSFWVAYPLGNLGRMALHNGDLRRAHQLIGESVAIARDSGSRGGLADWLFRLGQVQLFRGQLGEAEASLRETLLLYDETDNAFGPPSVLANLALVAVKQGALGTAKGLVQDCFERYKNLQNEAQTTDSTSDFLASGDALDSLLCAGLVACATTDWQTALSCFSLFERNPSGYETTRPFQEMVKAAKDESQMLLPAVELETMGKNAHKISLPELLNLLSASPE